MDYRIQERAFCSEITSLIKPHAHLMRDFKGGLSTDEEDTKYSFDLVVSQRIRVAVRIRDNAYLRYRDFTIRSVSLGGRYCEIDKIMDGHGDYFFYCWLSKDGGSIESYIIIDIERFRPLIDTPNVKDRPNGDGTSFNCYSVSKLKSAGAIVFDSKDLIIKEERVKVINGNCMDYLRDCDTDSFDLAVVDPPYGIDINSSGRLGHYGGRGKTWDSAVPSPDYFVELMRVSKNQIIWGGNYFYLPPTRCFLIWDKQQPEGVSFASCEYAWTSFDQSAKTFYLRPIAADRERIHPTQKPEKLYDWIYSKYAEKDFRVLDTHLGSGSSAISAHYFGCEFVGIEIDEDYYKAALERINRATQQGSLF